jgi:hypothetical protein
VDATVELTIEDLDRALTGLDTGDAPRLLVVDDAHALSRRALHHLATQALQRPHRVRVVLLSRWDLPLADLRAELRGDLAVLRGDLLRLDEQELTVLVRRHSHTDPRTDSREVVELIADWSRGWCAPAVLAAQAVGASADAVSAARRYTRSSAVPRDLTSDLYSSLTVPQRQVLLCLAGDTRVSASQARHLSRVSHAGSVLEELASTGLLARRAAPPPSASREREQELEYLLHPVLVETARRRLTDGGGDVLRARTTLRDVVDLDIGRGVLPGALHRLVAVGDIEAASQVLTRHGLLLVLAGPDGDIDRLLRDHPREVESRPSGWLAVASHLWLADDVPATEAWLERLEAWQLDRDRPVAVDAAAAKEAALERLCVQLMRALLGNASLSDAALRGRELVRVSDPDQRPDVPVLWLAQLLHGVAALQLGRLPEAETSLSRAAHHGRTRRLPLLRARAVSALAIVAILQGREHVALELTSHLSYVEARRAHRSALLARHFAHVQARVDVDDMRPLLARRPGIDALHEGDLVASVLTRVHDARVHLLRGDVAAAERALDAEQVLLDLPLRLQVLVTLERALHAGVALDRDRLDSLAKELDACNVLRQWRQQAPAILVIEDLDWLVRQINVSTLLNLLDGVDSDAGAGGLLLIATTNNPQELDPAINNRPGRFDVVNEIDRPDEDMRRELLRRKLPETDSATLDAVAEATDGLSFAQVMEVLRLSGFAAIAAGRSQRTEDDLLEAAKTVSATNEDARRGFPIKPDAPFGLSRR